VTPAVAAASVLSRSRTKQTAARLSNRWKAPFWTDATSASAKLSSAILPNVVLAVKADLAAAASAAARVVDSAAVTAAASAAVPVVRGGFGGGDRGGFGGGGSRGGFGGGRSGGGY